MAALKIDMTKLKKAMTDQMNSDGKYNISSLSRMFETTRTTIRKYMAQIDKELGNTNEKKQTNDKAATTSKKQSTPKKTNRGTAKSVKNAGTKFDIDKLEELMLEQLEKDGKYNISELSRLMESSRGTVKKYMDKIDKTEEVKSVKTIPCPKHPSEVFPLSDKVVKENHLPTSDKSIESIDTPTVEFMIGHNMAMINFLDGKGTQTILASECNFPKLTEALKSQDISAIKSAMSKEVMLKEKSGGKTTLNSNGQLIHNGLPVSPVMQEYVDRHFKDGDIPVGFFKFLDKVYVKNSYSFTVCPEKDFMEYIATGNIIINDDGNLLAYKIVASTYRDKHSGSYLYRVGETYEMPRSSVTLARNTHCAPGFHACTFKYFQSYAAGGNRVLVCEIDPRDVISIPNDLKSKLRCCKYKMIGDLGVYPHQKPLELWYNEYLQFNKTMQAIKK